MFWLVLASVLLRYPDDEALVARLQNRDPEAMGELYDRYGRLGFAVIQRIVGDRAVAEDLLQESFLRVWTRARSFDALRGALGPWILTVCRNQALDYLRSVEGRSWRSMATTDTERASWFQDVETELLDRVRLRQIRQALAKLTDRQRQVIELAFFEGLSQSEMAARLDQPLGTVKTWMRGALQVLRNELGVPVTA